MEFSLASFVDRIAAAAAAKAPLRIRGGGSKDFYGELFDTSLPVLETSGYSGIVSYEPSELVVTVKAGTSLNELETALAQRGQCLAFEPPHFAAGSSVGGMVAAGLAGPSRACAGGLRDYVLGAHLINGRGELLEFGGQVMKNVAGYDVSRALAGSMGALGLITQVSLKVLPIATAEATLRFEMDEATAIRCCNEWAGQPLPLNASSWINDSDGPSLFLRLRGAVAAVESACSKLANESGGVRLVSDQKRLDWQAARDLKLPWFLAGFARGDDLWRISVPQITPPLDLGDTMIDWLGAQRWLFVPVAERLAASQRLRDAAHRANGTATLFRASWHDGASATPRFDAPNPALSRLHRELKNQFDPVGIFNPGRLGVI